MHQRSWQVYKAISSFKAGSAAGPSGLMGEHLKEARGKGEGRGAAAMHSKIVETTNPKI